MINYLSPIHTFGLYFTCNRKQNFVPGIAVFLSSVKAVEYGIVLAIAIALHNIPEGIAVCAQSYIA